MSAQLEQLADVTKRMDVLKNIAAKGWPGGIAVGFCGKCGKEREYDWDQVAKIMAHGFPRHCGQRIELRT